MLFMCCWKALRGGSFYVRQLLGGQILRCAKLLRVRDVPRRPALCN